MTLRDICSDITSVMDGIYDGTVSVQADNLFSAMKPGHPVDIMFGLYHDVEEAVLTLGQSVPRDRLVKLSKDLKQYAKAFSCTELKNPVKSLDKWLKQNQEE